MTETAAKHTAGPWYALTVENGGLLDQAVVFSECETDGEPTLIADTMPIDDEVPLEQRKANARLIAAAPDLLAALKTLLRKFENCARQHGNDDEVIATATEFARAAVAKAEGRTP